MTVDAELLRYNLDTFDALCALVAGMDDEAANTVPPWPGANSCYQLLIHCLGVVRRWSSTVARGIPVPRDRDAEFTASGSVAELLQRARACRDAFEADVRALDDAAAPAASAGRDDWYEQSNHAILLHVFRELAQHLGHAEQVRDAVAAGRASSR